MIQDWFEWNGVRCTAYGIHVTELPPVTVPEERVTFTDVPGLSGSLTTLEGENVYRDLTMTARCVIPDESRLPEITGWLRGGGQVTFANRPGGFYKARITNQIPFERIVRGRPNREFVVNFRCQPFWYVQGTSDLVVTTSGTRITNPGTVTSAPVIAVQGSGNVSLMIGAQLVMLNGLVSGTPIILDTVLQEAYSVTNGLTTSQNSKMTGDFFLLQPGYSTVSWSGSVTKVTITPHWRYL